MSIRKRAFWIVGCLVIFPLWCGAVEDFSFIHVSDDHFPRDISAETYTEMAKRITPVQLAPYGITAPTPSFLFNTGDLTEFGGGRGVYKDLVRYLENLGIPFYHVAGNHDNTWHSMRPAIKQRYGAPFYSFDQHGCHFIGLESAGIHEPLPALGREMLLFLENDLRKVSPDTPLFIFIHHKPDGSEFASRLERDRIVDLLRAYKSVLFLTGHGHSAASTPFDDMDCTQGGSTYGPNDRGWVIATVVKDHLYVAFVPWGETQATRPLLERPLFGKPPYLRIDIDHPRASQTFTKSLPLKVSWTGKDIQVASATYQIDDGDEVAITVAEGACRAEIDISSLLNGAHYLRFNAKDSAAKSYHRTVVFYKETSDAPRALWRTTLLGSSKCTPTLSNGMLYVGANDGFLYALDARNGKIQWKFETGLEVIAKPLLLKDSIFFGSADGNFYAVSSKGKLLWKTPSESGDGFYSWPATDGKNIFSGCDDGYIYCFDAASGNKNWVFKDTGYAVESAVCFADDVVYAGSWDRYIYALTPINGALKWKTLGSKSSTVTTGASRYYAPADNGPLAVSEKMFCTDRGYELGYYDAKDGRLFKTIENVSAIALSEDQKSLYLRGNTNG
ncbi:MAG TPA: PQQ-binding-like beta-propeller repeat protein, partial [bacterium]|nr:PQQ-binding-like beta-propeller repeat protein [bacterium]